MRPWIKLPVDLLNDPKMGRMSDRLYRRTIELLLIAGESWDNEGILPSVEDMAWILRIDEAGLLDDLAALQKLDIVHEDKAGNWVVTHFAELQDTDERAANYRRTATKRTARYR